MKIEDMSNFELSNAIDEFVRGERERAILKRRLIDLIHFEPLAEEFDLSLPQIKRVVHKSQEQLFKGIERK